MVLISNWEIVIDTGSLPTTVEYGDEIPIPKVYLRGRYFAKGLTEVEAMTTIDTESDSDVCIGALTNRYSAKYFLYKNQASANIFVIDSKPPVIELQTNESLYTPIGGEYLEEGFTAHDECDGDLTERVITFINGNTVTYFVQDNSGNSCMVERAIRYADPTPPTIELNGESNITLSVGEKYVESGAVAMDDIDGDLTNQIKISGSINTDKAGQYVIEYSVKDAYGNQAIAQRTIEVVDYVIAPKNGQTIYLTFDDGPCHLTPQLLDVLDKYNVKATFFVVGNGEHTHIIKDIVDRGHAIGIHTVSHNYRSIYSSTNAFMNELYSMQKTIEEISGVKTYLMRFPGGSSNTVSKNYSKGIMTKLASMVDQEGFSYFDWNVDSEDASGKFKESEPIFENVTKGVQDFKHSIVLQHDNKDFSVEAVESIIRWGLENGYTFDVLSNTSPTAHHKINN
jgi:peptidoglycan/xylan/chitin deacetylase (PgdA/CDA1 family)